MITGFILTIRERGLALAGRGRRNDRADRARGAAEALPQATGVVQSLRDRGFGYITRDTAGDRTDLYFHGSAVAGGGFDRLRVGQHVSFDEEADPRDRNRQRAVNVRPTSGDGA